MLTDLVERSRNISAEQKGNSGEGYNGAGDCDVGFWIGYDNRYMREVSPRTER